MDYAPDAECISWRYRAAHKNGDYFSDKFNSVMVNFPGRNGRRRRVLNEEVLSASSSHTARQAMKGDDATPLAPRYSDAAGVENHPQVTDFVPRRYRTIILLLLTGLASTVTVGALHHFAPTLSASAGMPDIGPFDLAAPSSLAAWIAAVVLLLSSATCLLVYSIRRHRIDDYRGRYRIWPAAAVACLILSADSVAGLHQVLAYSLSHVTGWTALRAGAAWWLALVGLPVGWIAVRTLLDVKECRLAATLLIAAVTCYVAAVTSYLGFLPLFEPRVETLITGVTSLMGNWLAFSAVVSYTRFVVLDAQGLVSLRRPNTKKRPEKAKPRAEAKPASPQASLLSAAGYTRQKSSPAETADESNKWIDGSRPVRESYDDGDDEDSPTASKLSKADRKRLRKLKAQNRAA